MKIQHARHTKNEMQKEKKENTYAATYSNLGGFLRVSKRTCI
jgi:hypothetical protein